MWFVFKASSSSSSWTHYSSLRDLRQDDHHLGYLYYQCHASVSMLSLYVALPIIYCQPLLVAMKPLTFDTFPANRCLAMLPACSAPLIALLVAREDEGCSMLELVVGISQYLLLLLTHLYTWQWVEGLAFCSVFCSTHATLGTDKPALCSLILCSLHGWLYGDPLIVRFCIKILQQGPTLVLICS